jgi:hypothetical protein
MLSVDALTDLSKERNTLSRSIASREARITLIEKRTLDYPPHMRRISENVLAGEEAVLADEEKDLAALNRWIDDLLDLETVVAPC